MRFVPRVSCSMTTEERAAGDAYFAGLRCGHLQWRIAAVNGDGREAGQEDAPVQRVRTYAIKR